LPARVFAGVPSGCHVGRVIGAAIGEHVQADGVVLREGENDVIAVGTGSRFVFVVNVG